MLIHSITWNQSHSCNQWWNMYLNNTKNTFVFSKLQVLLIERLTIMSANLWVEVSDCDLIWLFLFPPNFVSLIHSEIVKKLNMSRLDFLRERGRIRRENTMPISSVPHRWSSESKLDASEAVSSLSDVSAGLKTLSSRNRLSFSDFLKIKRNPGKAEDAKPHSHTSGILDMLKRKFKGNFKIARSEHSCFKEMTKHQHNLSMSVSSISESLLLNHPRQKANLPQSQTLASAEEPCQQCQFPTRTKSCDRNLCGAQAAEHTRGNIIPLPEMNQVKSIVNCVNNAVANNQVKFTFTGGAS